MIHRRNSVTEFYIEIWTKSITEYLDMYLEHQRDESIFYKESHKACHLVNYSDYFLIYFVHNKYVNKRKWQDKTVIQETLWSKKQVVDGVTYGPESSPRL